MFSGKPKIEELINRVNAIEACFSNLENTLDVIQNTLSHFPGQIARSVARETSEAKAALFAELRTLEKAVFLCQRFACGLCGCLMNHLDDKMVIQENLNLMTNEAHHLYVCTTCYPSWKEKRIAIFKAEDELIAKA